MQESYSVQVVPGAAPAVAFGHVVVADLDGRVVEIIALVIAQSAAMEYYESDVDDWSPPSRSVLRGWSATGRCAAGPAR